MSDPSTVLFVFFFLFASGLTVHVFEYVKNEAYNNTGTVNASAVNVSKDKEGPHDPMVNNAVKKIHPNGDRLLNQTKERSVVKIIKKCKKPRYKLRDTVFENELFSHVGHKVTTRSGVFYELYNQQEQNENYVKPEPTLNRNTTGIANKLNTVKAEYSNLPNKSYTNDSDIEIVRNTILRLNAIPNYPNTVSRNQKERRKNGSNKT